MDDSVLWNTVDRSRFFIIIPKTAELPPGVLALRTTTGREQSVDEAAVLPYEVSEAEAKTWAEEQLRATLGEARGKVLDFVDQLKTRTAEMREENRRTWEEGVANAPPELRDAANKARSWLRDLGQTLQRVARENIARTEAGRQKTADNKPDAGAEKPEDTATDPNKPSDADKASTDNK